MLPTATLINLYHICHRELWLHANEIRMESHSDTVSEGRLLHETTYPRRSGRMREIQIENIKIDYYDPVEKVVHETKKSDKMEEAHIAQVKYYLWVMELHGIEGATGLIEYPSLKRTQEVVLTDDDRVDILRWVEEIGVIVGSKECPARIKKTFCKTCSYFDFCWVEE